jgi:hypothetical protein
VDPALNDAKSYAGRNKPDHPGKPYPGPPIENEGSSALPTRNCDEHQFYDQHEAKVKRTTQQGGPDQHLVSPLSAALKWRSAPFQPGPCPSLLEPAKQVPEKAEFQRGFNLLQLSIGMRIEKSLTDQKFGES